MHNVLESWTIQPFDIKNWKSYYEEHAWEMHN